MNKNRLAIAKIEWLTAAAGGRTSGPPPGPTYRAPARVGSWTGNAPQDANFTLEAKLISKEDDFHWDAVMEFIVAEAPHNSLQRDAAFEFYEGRRCVARGRIIDVLAKDAADTIEQR